MTTFNPSNVFTSMNKNKLDLTLGTMDVSNVILMKRVWYLTKTPFTILNTNLIDIHLSLILCKILCLGFHDLYQFGELQMP
jgi:hypothetical protein